MSPRRGVALVLLTLLVLSGRVLPGDEGQEVAEEKVDPIVLDQAWQRAKTMFYDPRYRGIDWDAIRAKYRARAEAAITQRELHDVVTDMLGELKASHTELIEADYMERFLKEGPRRTPVPQFGMTITKLEQGYFISRVLPGSASHAGGVRRGDRLVAIEGRPPNPDRLLPVPYESGLGGPRSYLIPCKEGTKVELELERTPTPLGRYEVTLRAHGWNETEAGLHSRRVIQRDGFKLGYVRIYHLLGYDNVTMTHDLILRRPDLDGMIVDLRGRGGMPEAAGMLISFFDRTRIGGLPEKTTDRANPRKPSGAFFSKPVVALTDRGTRSVKEMIAFEWRRRRIGALVGQRTTGAFLGVDVNGFRPLEDGCFLMVPSIDMRAVAGGVDIEGDGVPPDIEVEDPLPYSNGADPILEAGVRTLRDAILASKRRKGAWY